MALGRGAKPAHRIAGDRVFDLEHLGAELAHDRRRVGSGEKGADIDDPDPVHRRYGGEWRGFRRVGADTVPNIVLGWRLIGRRLTGIGVVMVGMGLSTRPGGLKFGLAPTRGRAIAITMHVLASLPDDPAAHTPWRGWGKGCRGRVAFAAAYFPPVTFRTRRPYQL